MKASYVETRLPEFPVRDDLDNCAGFATVAQKNQVHVHSALSQSLAHRRGSSPSITPASETSPFRKGTTAVADPRPDKVSAA